MNKKTRQATCKAIELAEQGLISWEIIARCCLDYMSEQEVVDMARTNDLFLNDDVESENE